MCCTTCHSAAFSGQHGLLRPASSSDQAQKVARLAHPDAVRELVARQVRRRRRRLPACGRAALGVRVTAPGQHAVVPVIPLQQRDTHLQTGRAGASAVLRQLACEVCELRAQLRNSTKPSYAHRAHYVSTSGAAVSAAWLQSTLQQDVYLQCANSSQ